METYTFKPAKTRQWFALSQALTLLKDEKLIESVSETIPGDLVKTGLEVYADPDKLPEVIKRLTAYKLDFHYKLEKWIHVDQRYLKPS